MKTHERATIAIQHQAAGIILQQMGRNQKSFEDMDAALEWPAGKAKRLLLKMVKGESGNTNIKEWAMLAWATGDGVLTVNIVPREDSHEGD